MAGSEDSQRRAEQSRLAEQRLREHGVRVIQMEMPDINGTVRGKVASMHKGLARPAPG